MTIVVSANTNVCVVTKEGDVDKVELSCRDEFPAGPLVGIGCQVDQLRGAPGRKDFVAFVELNGRSPAPAAEAFKFGLHGRQPDGVVVMMETVLLVIVVVSLRG